MIQIISLKLNWKEIKILSKRDSDRDHKYPKKLIFLRKENSCKQQKSFYIAPKFKLKFKKKQSNLEVRLKIIQAKYWLFKTIEMLLTKLKFTITIVGHLENYSKEY